MSLGWCKHNNAHPYVYNVAFFYLYMYINFTLLLGTVEIPRTQLLIRQYLSH